MWVKHDKSTQNARDGSLLVVDTDGPPADEHQLVQERQAEPVDRNKFRSIKDKHHVYVFLVHAALVRGALELLKDTITDWLQ